MLRLLVLSSLALATLTGPSQRHPGVVKKAQPDIVGTWMADPRSAPKGARPVGIAMEFKKDGVLAIRGPEVNAAGTYRVQGNTVTITIVSRNGVAQVAKPAQRNTMTIVDNGRALVADSGIRKNGKVVMMRLIRALSPKGPTLVRPKRDHHG